ncbi:MAG: EVE domain-containing protein [Ketobacteraceae bacterium]|nr:EVE domain-containing protein [Ketobacteraceae bacterium]
MKYWLFKSEPDEYSMDDLANEPSGVGRWDGIRNYQARNLLRDEVSPGDQVLFYYSSCPVPGVAGRAEVVSESYPDPAQFDAGSPYYDPRANASEPRWYAVDIRFVEKFPAVISRKALQAQPALGDMVLFRQGRLSVQPVTRKEWRIICALAEKSA